MRGTKQKLPFEDLGELLQLVERLGDIPPSRVCLDPFPGTATERDLLRKHGRPHKLYELIEGTLVEKAMGHVESIVAAELIRVLGNFIKQHQLGYFSGSDDLIRLMPKVVRGPDVSFTSWTQRPDRTADTDSISDVIPSLVVEVLSKGNTRAEIAKKLKDYFFAGVQLAWVIDPKTRAAEAYTAPDAKTAIPADGELDGGDVLPGFSLPLAELFETLPAPIAKKPKGKKKK
jgi:Uma2 family endonuclease